ncbi:unnamed protein product [Dracunculus medinensis]|uniref:VWFA domain-containing protein n=1 Tax=Dracunculus medinensis TaxID=318479 RepID=A0A0N4U8H7_DRAME|nr:unnamed protein product [Dracunculus medinensis]
MVHTNQSLALSSLPSGWLYGKTNCSTIHKICERAKLLNNRTNILIKIIVDSLQTLSPQITSLIQLAENVIDSSFATANQTVVANCDIDLVFVIDTSQSVEDEFAMQLQFATDLVKAISPSDLGSRIRIAAISFYTQTATEFNLDQSNSRQEVLDALSAIKHTGGGTSIASGVNLAVHEFETRGKIHARRMVVLISDGNSQDTWDKLLIAANRLRSINANVYVVTASSDYFFRELEIYAGSKWFVFTDARKRQFLGEAKKFIGQCENQIYSTTKIQRSTVSPIINTTFDLEIEEPTSSTLLPLTTSSAIVCKNELVDIAIVIDTSTSVDKEFDAEKSFALDLIKILPETGFIEQFAIAIIQFAGNAKLTFGFGQIPKRDDILYEIDRIENSGGQTSLVAGINEILKEIERRHRPNARLITVIISDGNSQDSWPVVQKTAGKLRDISEVYAVTLSPSYYYDELKEYTGSDKRVYVDDRISQFLKEVGISVLSCTGQQRRANAASDQIYTIFNNEFDLNNIDVKYKKLRAKIIAARFENVTLKDHTSSKRAEFAIDEIPTVKVYNSETNVQKCNYSKMDLEIILDASSSRQEVFEHQRELALSLIERLPIDADETHVAVGINSFTQVPTLRQTLGLGRDKQMVRNVIENIKYKGGSTLTARAVQLSVQDLQRGRRPDAIQVVVLMNDGMSQDPWDAVLLASDQLRATGAERFGVALGENIDLRELKLYIGNEDRIYRDGSTERFLSDVVNLLTAGKNCSFSLTQKPTETNISNCKPENLDIIILFDNADETDNLSDPAITANRYLLLDILGSLPVETGARIRFSINTFTNEPKSIISLSDRQERQLIFNKVETIKAEHGKSSYARVVNHALNEYEKSHRTDARGILLIVGDGKSEDDENSRKSASQRIKAAKGLTCFAVDGRKSIDSSVLAEYTGSEERVFNYDKNAEFARIFLQETSAPTNSNCSTYFLEQDKSLVLKSIKNIQNSLVDDLRNTTLSREVSIKQGRLSPKSSKAISELLATTTIPPRISATSLNSKLPMSFEFSNASEPSAIEMVAPGCKIDLIIILDSSGSVEDSFDREKQLASGIVERLTVGPNDSRIAIIKFAAKEKVRTIWSFKQIQSQTSIRNALKSMTFSSGTTAIDTALLQAIAEYTPGKGARPGQATPVCIIFTDGFGQKDATESANLLRSIIPNVFSVAVTRQMTVNRHELEKIAGSKQRVFTDDNILQFYAVFEKLRKNC